MNEAKEIALAFALWMDNRRKQLRFRLATPNDELFNEFMKERERINNQAKSENEV